MQIEYILELIKSCESVSEFEILPDFLGKESCSLSVKLDDVKQSERTYCDGGGIFSREAEIDIRLLAGAGVNLENKKLLEAFCRELSSFGKTLDFPPPSAEAVPLKIEITEGAELISDEIHSAKYRLKFKIYFIEK